MAAGPPPRPAALHPDLLLLDQTGRTVVRRATAALPGPRRVLLPRRPHHRTGELDQVLERQRPALQMDQDRRPDHRPHLPLLLTHLRTGSLAGVVRGPGLLLTAGPGRAEDELQDLPGRLFAGVVGEDVDAGVAFGHVDHAAAVDQDVLGLVDELGRNR